MRQLRCSLGPTDRVAMLNVPVPPRLVIRSRLFRPALPVQLLPAKNKGFYALQAQRLKVPGRLFASYAIQRPHKFGVEAQFVQHAGVLAPHGTVHDCRAGSISYRPSSTYRDSAVNDSQGGLENPDVTGGLANKVLYFKWVADVVKRPPDRLSSTRRRCSTPTAL